MGAVQCTNCNRWFCSKGELSVHMCRPEAHAYFVSSFVPKFWGCVTVLIWQQYNRTGQDRCVCIYMYVWERECILQLGNSSLSVWCVCMFVQSSLLLLCSISIVELVWVHLTNHTHVVILRRVGRRDPSPSIGSSTAESLDWLPPGQNKIYVSEENEVDKSSPHKPPRLYILVLMCMSLINMKLLYP